MLCAVGVSVLGLEVLRGVLHAHLAPGHMRLPLAGLDRLLLWPLERL